MFQKVFSTLVLATFLVSAVVTGCVPVTVQQTTLKNTYTDVRTDILTTGELSQMTQQVLRMQGIRPAVQGPARTFQELEARSTREPDDDQQVALAEIALLTARRTESSDPTTAANWYVLAVARSYDFLFVKTPGDPLFDLRYERMRIFYLFFPTVGTSQAITAVDLSGEPLVCHTTPRVPASIPRALSASCWSWRC